MATSTTRRSQRASASKGDRREQSLLAAAERLLVLGSFESASVTDLAAAAGISRATFYFYFASKQALLSAVIAAAVGDLESRLEREAATSGQHSPAERVAETVRAATDLWWDHRVVLVASVELGALLPEVYERNLDSIRRVSRATVALLADAGRPHEAVTEPLVTALVLMTERNFYDLARRGARRAEYDVLAPVLTTIWLRALGLAEGED